MMKSIAMLALLGGLCLMAQRTGSEIFQEGLRKERSDGDLKGAIAIYERVVKEFRSDRKLAAQALLRIAQCQERQGAEAARGTYERLVREFADQAPEASEARTRIAAMAQPAGAAEPRVRRVWAGRDVNQEGSLSPDGRWLTYAHWATGDLGLRDLVNNSFKLLTNTGGWEKSDGQFAQDSRFSPDGRWIAYNWFVKSNPGGYELRLMDAGGSNVKTIGWAATPGYVVPFSWSQDGQKILAAHFDVKGLMSLHLVTVSSGDRRELISPGRFMGWGASSSPDGNWIALAGTGMGDSSDIFVIPAAGGTPQALVAHPSRDRKPVWSRDGRSVLFVTNRSGSDGLWRIPVENGKASGAAQLVRGLGANIDPIGFSDSGFFAYSAQVSAREIYTAPLDPATGKVNGKPVLVSERNPGNSIPSLSRDGKRIAFLTQASARQGSSITVRDLETGTEHTTLIEQVVRFLTWEPGGKRLLLECHSKLPNAWDLLWMDAATGHLTPYQTITPTRNRLIPTFSLDGKTLYIVWREWPERAFGVVAIEVASGERKILYKASYEKGGDLKGLALSPDGQWLATVRDKETTKEHLNRQVILVPAAGGEPRVIGSYRSEGGDFVLTPQFTPGGKHLVLQRSAGKPTDPNTELIRVDLASGEVEAMGVVMPAIHHPITHPSGNRIFFQAGMPENEIWIAENILPRQ